MTKEEIAALIERAERDGVDTALEGNMLLLDLAAALKAQQDEIEALQHDVDRLMASLTAEVNK